MKKTNQETIDARPIVKLAPALGLHMVRVHCGKVQLSGGWWMELAPTGTADYLGVGPEGRAVAVETKTAVGKLSPEQEQFRDDWRRRGGLWILARKPTDLVEGLR